MTRYTLIVDGHQWSDHRTGRGAAMAAQRARRMYPRSTVTIRDNDRSH